MYCPSCGKSINEGLKYCNGCGMRLAKDRQRNSSPDRMLFLVLGPLTIITIFGFGALIGLVAVLLKSGAPNDIVGVTIIAWLLTLFAIDFSLIRKATKIIDYRLKSMDDPIDNMASRQLPSVPAGQLEEFREPAMSVTDHTTRTLDQVPAKTRN